MTFLVCKLCSRMVDDESHASLGYRHLRAVVDDHRARAGGWLCGDCIRDVVQLSAERGPR